MKELDKLMKELNEVNLDIGYEFPSLSIIISTYNRCPYKPGENGYGRNPLEWSIHSTINSGEFGGNQLIKEIIVVDDESQDHTPEVVDRLKERFPLIRYIRVEEKFEDGWFNPLNLGVEKAEGKIIKIQGDDSWLHPYNIPLGLFYMKKLRVAVIKGPCYERRTSPIGIIPLDEIGKIKVGNITSNFDYWPQEYFPPPYLFKEARVVKPIKVDNLGGNRFCYREVTRKIGLSGNGLIEMGYGTEVHFAIKLTKKGHAIAFSPDPKLSSIHFRFGDVEYPDFDFTYAKYYGLTEKELKEMIDLSSKFHKSGCRMNSDKIVDEWLYKKIRNHGRIILKKKGIKNFIVFASRYFKSVIDGSIIRKNYPQKLNLERRLAIYLEAMGNAITGKKREA